MVRTIIERPIAVTMTLVAVVILGIAAMNLLPVSLVPDVDIPQVTVQITAKQLSARELDSKIVKRLVNQLVQINNIKDITSETKDGSSTIFIEFNYDVNINYSFIEVNEKIDRASAWLPDGVERPKAIKASATDIPAFYLNISLKKERADFVKSDLYPVSSEFTDMSAFVSQVIVKRIEQLDAVAMVDISGTVGSEVLIIPNKDKLKLLGVDDKVIDKALEDRRADLGNISVQDGEYRYNIRLDSKLTSKKEIENTHLKIEGRVYQIKDISTVIEHPSKPTGIVISDFKDAVTLAVIKQSDAQMASFKEEVDILIKQLNSEYKELHFTSTRNQTQLLEYSISNLISNIFIGGMLACLVLFFFMKDMRTPFLITLSIPMSVIVSLLMFYVIGITINIISLSGFVLGIGMMVDNSIVVIDNITQRWSRGDDLKTAVSKGTTELFGAMLSSVLTTCSVFIPLIFLSDISGALFYDQAMSVAISLFASLIVAMTVVPLYYYLMYRGKVVHSSSNFFSKLKSFDYHKYYEKSLVWLFRKQWIVAYSFVAAIVLTVVLAYYLPKESLPQMTQNDMLLTIDWNDKINLDENIKRVEIVQKLVKDDVEQITSMVGDNQFMLSHTPKASIEQAVLYLKCVDNIELLKVEQKLKEHLSSSYKDALFSFNASGNIFDMIFSDKQAQLVARLHPTNGKAPEPYELNRLLGDISAALPLQEIEPIAYNQQVSFIVRSDIMALYRVNSSMIIRALQSRLSENRLFTIIDGTSSTPVVIGDNKVELYDLLNDTYITVEGNQVALSTFMLETKSQDLKNIISGSDGDFYPLALNVDSDDVPAVMESISAIVAQNSTYEVDYGGSYFASRKLVSELAIILMVSLALLFFILAAEFESLIQPFIVLSEIVIDLVGAFIMLWIFDSSLNLMSMIGIVVMCGIVINDSILKVDTINKLRKGGYSTLRAILVGGYRRLTPIIMTSATTIMAIVPFLHRGSIGNDLQFPLSIALLGGMVIGTIVSIYYVPILYYWIYKNRK